MENKVYTSAEILAMDVTALADILCESDHFLYRLTEGEAGWFGFVDGRYAIADAIYYARVDMDPIEEGTVIDVGGCGGYAAIRQALTDDGTDRATMLSDDTALQRIVWIIGPEEE
jgi:hypothetical protein